MENFIITHKKDLLQLAGNKKPAITGRIGVLIDSLNDQEKNRYEQQLNDWYHACGCETGAIFCVAAIAGYLIFTLSESAAFDWPLVRNGMLLLVGAGCSAPRDRP